MRERSMRKHVHLVRIWKAVPHPKYGNKVPWFISYYDDGPCVCGKAV